MDAMRYGYFKLFLLLFAVLTAGCAYNSVEKFAYEGLHDRECMINEGHPKCDPGRTSYETYEKQRQEIKKE